MSNSEVHAMFYMDRFDVLKVLGLAGIKVYYVTFLLGLRVNYKVVQ
jgi:hypothetical protein